MLTIWIYSLPTWLMGLIFSVFVMAITTGGLVIVHSRWSVDLRRQHNDIAGFVIAVVGVVYAVLIASIAVMAWESYDDADRTVTIEAELVGDIHRDVVGLGPVTSAVVRKNLRAYVEAVLSAEWPEMARGEPPSQGWGPLADIVSTLSAYRADTSTREVYLHLVLTRLSELYDARHERLVLATRGIHPVIWSVVGLGGVITIAFTFFFGLSSIRVHLLMSNGLALTIALVITMIAALDHPFLGDVDISAKPFEFGLPHPRSPSQ